jgi:hypothetical protein
LLSEITRVVFAGPYALALKLALDDGLEHNAHSHIIPSVVNCILHLGRQLVFDDESEQLSAGIDHSVCSIYLQSLLRSVETLVRFLSLLKISLLAR